MNIEEVGQLARQRVTKYIFLGSLMLSIFCEIGMVSPFAIVFDIFAIRSWELWRLVTGVLYLGKFSLKNIMFIINNISYMAKLENSTYAGNTKKFICFILYVHLCTIFACIMFNLREPSTCFFGTFSYFWTRAYPEEHFLLFMLIPF